MTPVHLNMNFLIKSFFTLLFKMGHDVWLNRWSWKYWSHNMCQNEVQWDSLKYKCDVFMSTFRWLSSNPIVRNHQFLLRINLNNVTVHRITPYYWCIPAANFRFNFASILTYLHIIFANNNSCAFLIQCRTLLRIVDKYIKVFTTQPKSTVLVFSTRTTKTVNSHLPRSLITQFVKICSSLPNQIWIKSKDCNRCWLTKWP